VDNDRDHLLWPVVRINIGGWKVVGCGSEVVREFVQILGPGQLVGLLALGSVPLDPMPMNWERKGIDGRLQSSLTKPSEILVQRCMSGRHGTGILPIGS
jgi:hypothetical protein